MHPIKTFLTKRKIKQVEKEIKQVEKDLKNVYICMTDWSHGEMGYTQAPEELTELEKEETNIFQVLFRLKEKRIKLYNDLILWSVADKLNAKNQKTIDEKNKEVEELVRARDN